MLTDAKRVIDGDPEIGGQNLLLVAGEGWHRGVIGIVASKLVDAYSKPAVVLSIDNGIAHGSARSIGAFDLLGALESCADVFIRFGGHRQAAGLTIESARIPELRRRLAAIANERLGPEDLVPRLRIDAPLGLREISGEVIEALARLGPFGAANPEAGLPGGASRADPTATTSQRASSVADAPPAGPVVSRDCLAGDRTRGVPECQPVRFRARVFARAGRIPGREDHGADRGGCPVVGRRRRMRWQRAARYVVAAIGVGTAVALFVLRREAAG